jgi:tetratricopeptide (TPR) repeat protein
LNVQEAERCYRKAIELDPNEAGAFRSLSYLCLGTGRYEEAIDFALKDRAIDPYPQFPSAFLCFAYALAANCDKALEELTRMKGLYPNEAPTHLWCAITYGLLGMTEESVNAFDRLQNHIERLRESGTKGWIAGIPPGWFAVSVLSYAAKGQTRRIKEVIEKAERVSTEEQVWGSRHWAYFTSLSVRKKRRSSCSISLSTSTMLGPLCILRSLFS